jgi:GxxExxY protein
MYDNDKMVLKNETYNIIGACMEVHRKLGCSYSEKVYQDALEVELKLRNIPFEREKHLSITYKGIILTHDFFVDFICYDRVVVELKAVSELDNENREQVINYIHAANVQVGLLINFRSASLIYERYVNFGYHNNFPLYGKSV